MTRLTDGARIVEITMKVWDKDKGSYGPDISGEFYDVGGLNRDEKTGAYIVLDVEYCIEQANDWRDSIGDFYYDEPNDGNTVFVKEVQSDNG